MAKKSMVPFSAAVAADVLSAFRLPGGNALQWGCNFVEIKRAEAAGGSTKTPRDLQSAGRHTDDEGFGGYLSKRRSLIAEPCKVSFRSRNTVLLQRPTAGTNGRRVSAEEVHNNPLTKVYLCQTIGYDWRLQSPCAGYLPHGGGHP
jgi:hypothetical protein